MDFIHVNIRKYSALVGSILMLGVIPISLLSSGLGLSMMGGGLLLGAVWMVNNKLSFNAWF